MWRACGQEYPNESGAGNPYSSSDAANLLSFFKSLRSALGSSKIISAAVTQLPWTGPNGSPLTDVSAYASVMTYANIMSVPPPSCTSPHSQFLVPANVRFHVRRNYDVWGASSSPGPNAPLGNLCGTSSLPQYSAQAALSQWTAASFPASKLVLGLPLYGYVSQSTKTTLQQIARPPAGFDPVAYKEQILGLPARGLKCPLPRLQEDEDGKEEEGEGPNALNGNHERRREGKEKEVRAEAAAGDLSSYFGQQIAFNQLVALGALVKSSSGTYGGANGYTMGEFLCP